MSDILMVRLYLADGRDDIRKLMKWLETAQMRGFTVFRGVASLGRDGRVHKASLLDLSSELPMVIEFFDTPERVAELMPTLKTMIKPDHIVSWPAQTGF
ncbi:hypothetical protein Q7C_2157 [Methylophaga frappieri]|uniref:Uncharacterized protein n=1 Tax=Methylophaga frappieri (strain ATCC BAA-2434 / DSM 25690 / JAM7) TaxID=754477 RepID=I1YK50_METFJ|nr:DUF190 domain-containing protein [Methylophaga frappieri]AFJ03293.1 hypothetical protein Q7C_2157 [Methylophaga frappieri]